ncbi:MarR family winged helix-turn-helix transcriptional regulator [Streptomyces sp. SP18CS02]|uniref:MarR family winged helix-turn-helix transcriptional regulator n=1 Tax=Streptomyces sp. SP18CS02 TaxID=3002531 RepID=UPI002E79F57D|nr:MarR family transcriptional regulator [Streptomyces sp. SP18CS02]MEE1756456.1 MarR family transcriptional regulator [Streptomyces sp. SP18CS02]
MDSARGAGGRDEVALWRQLTRLTEQVGSAANRQLTRKHGVTTGELMVLLTLAEQRDGMLRMADLVEGSSANQSSVSRMVARLEEADWVTRMHCQQDKRGVNVGITEVGRRLAKEAEQTFKNALSSGLDKAALDDRTASLVVRLRYAVPVEID